MFKKVVIAGLLVALFIQKCKHIEDLKKNKTKLSVDEIDSLLNKSGIYSDVKFREFRINIKGLLHAAGILEDNGAPPPFPSHHRFRTTRKKGDYVR